MKKIKEKVSMKSVVTAEYDIMLKYFPKAVFPYQPGDIKCIFEMFPGDADEDRRFWAIEHVVRSAKIYINSVDEPAQIRKLQKLSNLIKDELKEITFSYFNDQINNEYHAIKTLEHAIGLFDLAYPAPEDLFKEGGQPKNHREKKFIKSLIFIWRAIHEGSPPDKGHIKFFTQCFIPLSFLGAPARYSNTEKYDLTEIENAISKLYNSILESGEKAIKNNGPVVEVAEEA